MRFVSNFARIFPHTSLSYSRYFFPKFPEFFEEEGEDGGDETKACARAPSRKIERHRLAYL